MIVIVPSGSPSGDSHRHDAPLPAAPSLNSQAYMLFAIGNIKPLFAIQMPNCFAGVQPPSCNQRTEQSIEYTEICGVILGMLAFGARCASDSLPHAVG